MNFAESLVCWYLRLNGFFLVPNFVLHRHANTVEYSADGDMLAVRFPNVYEEIGGQYGDWHTPKFEEWGLELKQNLIGLIVEVKYGRNTPDMRQGVESAFSRERLRYAMQRIGFWNIEVVDEKLKKFVSRQTVEFNNGQNATISKLLVCSDPPIRSRFHLVLC